MTDEEQAHVAEVMPNMEAKLFAAKDGARQTSLSALAFQQNPNEPWDVTMNRREWRTVEIASGSGHGNARGVARIYGALGLRRQPRRRLAHEQASDRSDDHRAAQPDRALQERPYHQAIGVLLNTPEAVYMGPNMRSFGHHGIGGSIGFCDPDARMGFSYAATRCTRSARTGRARRA